MEGENGNMKRLASLTIVPMPILHRAFYHGNMRLGNIRLFLNIELAQPCVFLAARKFLAKYSRYSWLSTALSPLWYRLASALCFIKTAVALAPLVRSKPIFAVFAVAAKTDCKRNRSQTPTASWQRARRLFLVRRGKA